MCDFFFINEKQVFDVCQDWINVPVAVASFFYPREYFDKRSEAFSSHLGDSNKINISFSSPSGARQVGCQA